jgi:hypothetical protein
MSTEDVFAGLPGYDPVQQQAYEAEARERWGDPAVDASMRRARGMRRDEAAAHYGEHEAIASGLAAKAAEGASVDDPTVQELVARHHAWVCAFWTPDADAYVGLGRLYVDDQRFRATYEAFGPGTAALLCEGIEVYAETALS